MPNVVAIGQISLLDLNDVIISGTPPSNPSVGTLWIDDSVTPNLLKKWDGSEWVTIGEISEEGTATVIDDVQETLGNMTNDGVIDYEERKVVKDKLMEIIGYVLPDAKSTTDFTGKVAGSTVENPHVVKQNHSTTRHDTTLLSPSNMPFENDQNSYNKLKTLDGTTVGVAQNGSGDIAQTLFSFNLIAEFERKFGKIPAPDTASKVAWFKNNITKLTCKWWGYGSSPSGYKASLSIYSFTAGIWSNAATHTKSTVTGISISRSTLTNNNMADYIDVNGYVHFLAYAEPSNGTTASTIYTDYVSLDIEYNISLPTTTTLDSIGVGDFYGVRQSALNAGIQSSDSKYTAVGTKYTDLKTYLESLTPQPTFTRNSVAYLNNGTQVAVNQPRFENGALIIEEGTTNLIKGDFEDGTSQGWSSFGDLTLSVSSLYAWQGTKSIEGKRTSTTNGYGGLQCYYSLNSPVVGDAYTFSAWVYVPSNSSISSIEINLSFRGGANSNKDNRVNFNITKGSWNRLFVTGTVDYTDRTQICSQINLKAMSLNEVYYVDGAQLEKKDHPTTFVDTSRSVEKLLIPTSSIMPTDEGTIEMELEVPYLNNWNDLLYMQTINNGRFLLYFDKNGKVAFDYGANNSGVSSPNGTIQQNTKTFIAIRWSKSQNKMALFVNGAKYEKSLPNGTATNFMSTIDIVWNYSAKLYNLRFSVKARDDNDILNTYQNGFSTDRYTTIFLDFENNLQNKWSIWDLSEENKGRVIPIDRTTFKDKWLQYYNAVNDLATATAQKLKDNVDDLTWGGTNWASNGDFSIDLTKARWSSAYVGQTKEIVDISAEDPPFQYALHIKNTTNANGGIFAPTIWSGNSANAMNGKEITVQFWLKYQNIVQGTNSYNLGRFGEIIVEGQKSDSSYVYSYYSITPNNTYAQDNSRYISGTNMTWKKYAATLKITMPAGAVKITKIQFKHGIEGCTGEFWTTGIKIEVGNKASDWSLCPFDITTRLTNVEFKIQDDQIISTVTSSSIFNMFLNSKGDVFDYTFENGGTYWRETLGGTDPVQGLTIVKGESKYGANCIQITGEKWLYYGTPIPINTDRTYRVKFRVRQKTDATTSGKAKVYAGVGAFDVNKRPLTTGTYGTHRYCGVVGQNITVADGWKEFEGTISGEGNEGYDMFIPGTKYAVPMFIVNYQGGDGTVLVDICSLEDITDVDALGVRIDSVEQRITDDAIISTVTSSETFQSALDGKADVDALGNLATKDDLNDLSEDFDDKLDTAIDNIDFTPYVTKSELEQTSDYFEAKFMATGGMNFLKNSVGYAGMDFWSFNSNNLLFNSDLRNGTTTYAMDAGWSLDTSTKYNNMYNTFKCAVTGLSSDTWRALYTGFVSAQEGDKFYASVYVYVPASHGIDNGAVMQIEWYNSTSRINWVTASINTSLTNQWQRVTLYGVAPAGTTKARIRVHPNKNGTFWVTMPQLEKDYLTEWSPSLVEMALDSTKNFQIIQTDELAVVGAGSGFALSTGAKIIQTVVATNTQFTLGFLPSGNGKGYVRLYDGDTTSTTYQQVLFNGEDHNYEVNSVTITPTSGKITVELCVTYDSLIFTNLMLCYGDTPLQWSQSPGEVYNTNIKMDINGLRVSQLNSDLQEVGYTLITPQEFAGYYDTDGNGSFEKVFYLNGDETVSKKVRAIDEFTMGTIKIVKVQSGGYVGWAFVPVVEQ